MEFKKLIRILSIAAVAVWLFCLSFLISYQVVEKQTQTVFFHSGRKNGTEGCSSELGRKSVDLIFCFFQFCL